VGHDGAIRASDSDRESVVEILRQAYTDGRLDLNEFDERTTAAYAAKTWADLRQLTSDLPVDAVLGADVGKPPVAAGTPWRPGMREPARPALPPRGPVFVPFLPIALFWLVLAGAVHATGLVIPVVIFLLVGLRLAGLRGRRGHGPGGSGPGTGGPAR
jgi:Domain of unknown function (DUF1707)